jgi:hypothetical protein
MGSQLSRIVRASNAAGSRADYRHRAVQRLTTVHDVGEEIAALAAAREHRKLSADSVRTVEEVKDLHKFILSHVTGPVPPLKSFSNLASVQTLAATGHVARTLSKRGQQAEQAIRSVVAEVSIWADRARHGFAGLLPSNAEAAAAAGCKVPALHWIHPSDRADAAFICVQCSETDAKLRAQDKPKSLGNPARWRALTCTEACQHECAGAAQPKNKAKAQDRRVADLPYGFSHDGAISKVLSGAIAAANADVTSITSADLGSLGPVFRCGAANCGLTMTFSRIVSQDLGPVPQHSHSFIETPHV